MIVGENARRQFEREAVKRKADLEHEHAVKLDGSALTSRIRKFDFLTAVGVCHHRFIRPRRVSVNPSTR